MFVPEMETGPVDRHRLGQPAGWVTSQVEILVPAGQASRILLSCN